jgi:hypothetical protein
VLVEAGAREIFTGRLDTSIPAPCRDFLNIKLAGALALELCLCSLPHKRPPMHSSFEARQSAYDYAGCREAGAKLFFLLSLAALLCSAPRHDRHIQELWKEQRNWGTTSQDQPCLLVSHRHQLCPPDGECPPLLGNDVI